MCGGSRSCFGRVPCGSMKKTLPRSSWFGGVFVRTAKVTVLPYDAAWKADFQAIKAELEAAAGDLLLGIEHVGSTSVEGMSAKPIIDIDAVMESYADFDALKARLAAIGYLHEGNLGIKDREAFCYEGKEHLRKHHLYVCPRNSAELARHIAFRNFLQSNKEAAAQYSRIKEEAAQLYPNDIDGYIRHKAPCIEALYSRIGLTEAGGAQQ